MKLPTFEELSRCEEQLDILEAPFDKPLFVAGPPGSGKTSLAIHRARMLTMVDRKAAIITYNRMLRRHAAILNNSKASVKTMHSFTWRDYIKRDVGPVPKIKGDDHEYDWQAMLAILGREATSGAVWDHLVVDEGQDLPEGFFRYASSYAAHMLTVFADDEQALRRQCSTLKQIKAAADLPDPVILKYNHRNCPEIAAVAEHFHCGRLPAATVRRTTIREIPRLIHSSSIVATAKRIADWAQGRGGGRTIGVVVDSNDTGKNLEQELDKLLPKLRVDRYDNKLKNEDSIDLHKPGITILNKESVKGQEFHTLFILELEAFIPFKTDAMRRAMYMMCARAQDYLLLIYGPQVLSQERMAVLPNEHLMKRG